MEFHDEFDDREARADREDELGFDVGSDPGLARDVDSESIADTEAEADADLDERIGQRERPWVAPRR